MDPKIQKFLEERREPAIWFRTVEKAVSKSRWGGLPSLPEGIEWPVSLETMVPLHFMAQIDLSGLPATPLPGCPFKAALPRQGMLYFFFAFGEFMPEWEEAAIGAAINSRVIYSMIEGPDRAAPKNLPMIGHEPGKMGGRNARVNNLLPTRHLHPYSIDTFWVPQFFDDDGNCASPLKNYEDIEAMFLSMANATGEPTPIYTSTEEVPSPPPSYYIIDYGDGRRRYERSGLQMFGRESQWFYGDEAPRDKSKLLLLELTLDAHELGSLQFWIKTRDLKAQRFERAYGNAYFS